MSQEQEEEKYHYHIVHQSLIKDATMAGIKVEWMGFLGLAGLIGFPMTGGTVTGMIMLVALLWAVKSYILEPVYEYDNDAIEVFSGAVFGVEDYYQSHSDINSPRGPARKSIPRTDK